MRNQILKTCLAVCLLILPVSSAISGGMEIPEIGARSVARGGAVVANVSDPTAAVLNPGALSKIKGIMFQYSHNLLWVDSSFARLDPADASQYLDPAKNETPFFALGMLGSLAYDLGTEHSTIALTVNGPNTTGHVVFPEEGSTRYLLNELDTLLIYYGLSYAYGSENFGVGLTAQYVHLPRLNFGIMVDAFPSYL